MLSVFMRSRMSPVVLAGNLKKPFLQIGIREPNKDAFWFHWTIAKDWDQVETLRFTRTIFGLGESSFLHNTTMNAYVDASKENLSRTGRKYLKNSGKPLCWRHRNKRSN